MPPPQQSITRDLRDQFKDKLKEWTVRAACGREYIQVAKLTKWMHEAPKGTTNVDLLLSHCRSKDRFSIEVSQITGGDRPCLLVFSILLEIDKGNLIELFRKINIDDGKLPLDLTALEKYMRSLKLDKGIAAAFDRRQWKYRPLRFELSDTQMLEPNRIIPICEKGLINLKGGTADVHQILVQEEFVSESIKKIVPTSHCFDPKLGTCYLFALKTYKEENENLYENETDAFRGLEKNKGLIRRLFDYSHMELTSGHQGSNEAEDEIDGKMTYNIVLEYGECDLQEYFEQHIPPILEDDQLSFWSDLFLVADAVKDIHEFERSSGGRTERYFGWHADIKPDNILCVRKQFKLADPGFARFEIQTDRKKDEKDATTLWGGTTTFGAPECYTGESQKALRTSLTSVPRTIDIWSLGCVFSVAATWIVFGLAGLHQFAELRKKAISQIIQAQSQSVTRNTNLEMGDYFHDGETVLDDIRQWHIFLRRAMRKNDTFTEQVLSLVENSMLLGDARSRISASDLCQELKGIKQNHSSPLPIYEPIKEALLKTKEAWANAAVERAAAAEDTATAPSQIRNPSHMAQQTRNWPKSNMLTASIQTALKPTPASGGSSASVQRSSRVLSPTYSRLSQFPQPVAAAKDSARAAAVAPDQIVIKESTMLDPKTGISTPQRMSTSPTILTRTSTEKSSAVSTVSTPRKSRSFHIQKYVPLFVKPRTDELLSKHYVNRDIMFLVDNGETMAEFWGAAKTLLSDLVTKARHVDKNGMELVFTAGENNFKATNKVANFAQAMDKEGHKPVAQGYTHMSAVLGRILAEYLRQYAKTRDKMRDKMRKLTIIVFTDGIWAGMKKELAVDNKIVEFSQRLKEERGNDLEEDERRVSIEFVQFGNDRKASVRLKRLDDQLKFRGVPDIVDTTAADGDHYKILLGSLDESFDAKDESGPQAPGSPDEPDESEYESVLAEPATQTTSPESALPTLTREPSSLVLPGSEQKVQQQYPRNPRYSQHGQLQPPRQPVIPAAQQTPSFQVSEH